MRPCKVYSIQENDELLPETDYYEVVHFDRKEPYVIKACDGNQPLLVEGEVCAIPIRQFSEISEFGTRFNTYIAFDKKLEDYVNLIMKEELYKQEASHTKEIALYKEDLSKLGFELDQLSEYNCRQRKEFMLKWDNFLFKLLLGSVSLFVGILLGLVSKGYL